MQHDFFIFAAEASGDLLGADLIENLLKTSSFSIQAVAGEKMRSFKVDCFIASEEFHVMGFLDVLKNLKKLWQLFKKIKLHLLENPPRVLVLIDYPGFNLRLAKALKKNGFPSPIIQYVCPTIWAWKKNRFYTLEKYFDHIFCLFPFEPKIFEKSHVKAIYVGHPLLKKIKKNPGDPKKTIISIFPGSRESVVKRNLPLQLEVAKQASQRKLGISYSSEKIKQILEAEIKKRKIKNCFFFPSKLNHHYMLKSIGALSTSGTINLELALLHVPSLIFYKTSWFDYLIAKYIFKIKLPFYCIVNIVAGKQIYPEFYGFRPDKKKACFILKEINDKKICEENYRKETYLFRESFERENEIKNPINEILNYLK
jgi:lipid-A-disaccharide synthase